METSFKYYLYGATLATFMGANAATIDHPVRKEVPDICDAIQSAANKTAQTASPQTVGARLVDPFVCGENAPFTPVIWETKEAWGGALAANALMLAMMAIARRADRKREEKKKAGTRRNTLPRL